MSFSSSTLLCLSLLTGPLSACPETSTGVPPLDSVTLDTLASETSDTIDATVSETASDAPSPQDNGAEDTLDTASTDTVNAELPTDTQIEDTSDDSVTAPASFCPPWPAAEGNSIAADPTDDLVQVIASANAGDTILLADGTYDVSAKPLWIGTPNLTLRSASGNRESVILDGAYVDNGSGEILGINADGVVIADITIQRSRYHPIHVTGSPGGTDGVVIYNVHLIDPGEQAIKVNRNGAGDPADGGLVACSRIEMTAAGRAQVESQTSSGSSCYTGGVDAHAARDWVVRDNYISGFWCSTDLSEHAVHFWRGSRDTLVERNLLVNNARGVGFGLSDGPARVYDDDPCGGAHDHYGGLVRNNMIIGTDSAMFASNAGMDGGIAFAHACDAIAVHNTIVSTEAPFASIEWRFPKTNATIINNLATGAFRERNDATAVVEGNLSEVDLDLFRDVAGFDATLASPGAGDVAVDAGVPGYEELSGTDFHGQPRDSNPDVGADEVP